MTGLSFPCSHHVHGGCQQPWPHALLLTPASLEGSCSPREARAARADARSGLTALGRGAAAVLVH